MPGQPLDSFQVLGQVLGELPGCNLLDLVREAMGQFAQFLRLVLGLTEVNFLAAIFDRRLKRIVGERIAGCDPWRPPLSLPSKGNRTANDKEQEEPKKTSAPRGPPPRGT